MGSDDLFHKRKAKKATDLKRKKAKRSVRKKILIVCEGSKTEPYYFEGARDFYQLSTLNVEIHGQGDDPFSLVSFALNRFNNEEKTGDGYDFVYCVFDKDSHIGYQAALDKIQLLGKKWVAINSVPSFEYWLLLHFVYTTKPFYGTKTLSSGKEVLKELRKYMPHYEKGYEAIFSELYEKLDLAKRHATRANDECAALGNDNPSTQVYVLIDEIQKLKQ